MPAAPARHRGADADLGGSRGDRHPAAGLYQVNVQIPRGAGSGDVPLKVQVGNSASAGAAYLRIESR
ncbi:MAG TPA: hypothetical protein VMG35_04090 [Bryobacteraceae bacterium]|nr:hypothetical protein [Bryobacteraceae bacterium]